MGLCGEVNGMMYSCHANSILDATPAANQPTTINATVHRKVRCLDFVLKICNTCSKQSVPPSLQLVTTKMRYSEFVLVSCNSYSKQSVQLVWSA